MTQRNLGPGTGGQGAIHDSLDLVAAAVGDPAPLVYARLFERFPDMASKFGPDPGDLVKGQMLHQALICLLDLEADGFMAGPILTAERTTHANLDIPAETFAAFFTVIHHVFREAAAERWTEEMETGWTDALHRIGVIVGAP